MTRSSVAAPGEPADSRSTRLDRLEAALAGLTETVRRLDARLAALEGGAAAVPAPPAVEREAVEPALAAPSAEAVSRALESEIPLLGRSVLILGGAFLIRMLADTGTLPPAGAAMAGLLYAAVWLALADRGAARGKRLSALFLSITSLVIACPLIVEATVRFGALAPPTAFALLGVAAALALAVAVRRGLRSLAWSATLLPIGAAFVLFVPTHAIAALVLLLVAVGAATVWVADTRGWWGPRWVAAAAADLSVVALLAVAFRRAGPYRDLRPGVALALALLLPAAYLATSGFRAVVRGRRAGVFEMLQTAAAVAIGFGGALWLARATGAGVTGLAAAGLLFAAGGYVVAFVLRRDAARRADFLLFSSVALVFCLIVPGAGATALFLWAALAVILAAAAVRIGSLELRAHAIVFLLFAAVGSGLLGAATFGLAPLPAGAAASPLVTAGVSAVLVYALLQARGEPAPGLPVRVAATIAALLGLLAIGALAVLLLARVPAVGRDAAALSSARTAVFSISAVAAAFAGWRMRRPELTWLSWGALAAVAGKIAVQDLPSGRPSTLVVSFAFFGLALLVVPRFLGRRRDPQSAEPSASPRPSPN